MNEELKMYIGKETCNTYEEIMQQLTLLFKYYDYQKEIDKEFIELIAKNILNDTIRLSHASAQFWNFNYALHCENKLLMKPTYEFILEMIKYSINKKYEIYTSTEKKYNEIMIKVHTKLPNGISFSVQIFNKDMYTIIREIVKEHYVW